MTSSWDERGQAVLNKVWRDLQVANQQRKLDEIKANPEKHRMTRIMSPGANTGYVYCPASVRRVSQKRQDRISFCVTKHRNAAGSFLMWRQVDRYKTMRGKWSWFETERFDFQWSTVKSELREIARKKAERDRLDWAHECAAKLPDAPAEVQMTVREAIQSMAAT